MSVANFEDYRDTFQCSFSQWPYSKAVVMVEIFSYKKILNRTPKGLQKIQARLSLPKLALPQPNIYYLTFDGLANQRKWPTIHGIELGKHISCIAKRAGVITTIDG